MQTYGAGSDLTQYVNHAGSSPLVGIGEPAVRLDRVIEPGEQVFIKVSENDIPVFEVLDPAPSQGT